MDNSASRTAPGPDAGAALDLGTAPAALLARYTRLALGWAALEAAQAYAARCDWARAADAAHAAAELWGRD